MQIIEIGDGYLQHIQKSLRMTIDPFDKAFISLLVYELISIVMIVLILVVRKIYTQRNRIDMSTNNLLIIQLEERRKYCSANHPLGILEECQVVRAQLCKCKHECRRIEASACTSGTLCVVGWQRRNISQKYSFKVTNIDTHFKCG